MRGNLPGPRALLRRLREAMAEPVGAQQRLDKITVLIAANMVAEVCSIYVLRGGDTLELFATEGLKREAVHATRLKVGEGLVGTIASEAEPLNLTEAQDHPAFAYRPETGEEAYHSFLGVPILRGGDTLGVLVVQNRARRIYSEEEVEALQTIAMLVAEMVASGEPGAEDGGTDSEDAAKPLHLDGVVLSEGIGLGHAVMHEPKIVVTNLISDDIDTETQRLNEGIESLRAWIDRMLTSGDVARAGDHRDVLEAYRMLAYDRGWARRIREAVATGLTAEAGVERVQSDARARMMRQTDPYMRERLHDLDDLSNRLLRILVGRTVTAAASELPRDAIIIARNMGPAELLDYDGTRLRGLILEEGGPSSHVAIVARALGIATVGQVEGIVEAVEAGDAVVVDGESGEVHVRPLADVESAYVDKVRFRARRQAQYKALQDTPAVSSDGEEVSLFINAGLVVEMPHLTESGAAGIGLYRTEFQFLLAATFPRMREQEKVYRAVLDAADGKPVVFRSLDVGGDKVMPFLRHAHEENPALGWRAIRMALDRPALLRAQVRALLHAAAGRELSLMFPMVSEVGEFQRARAIVDRELKHLDRFGHPRPRSIRLGAMIEVPSLMWQLDSLLDKADFVSVGSNDLLQFTWACDRSNARMAGRFDTLNPAVLRMLAQIVEAAGKHGKPLTLCGEMAGRPLEAMALLGIGFRSISMAPASIGPVKAMLLKLDIGKLKDFLTPLLTSESSSLRGELREFARQHKVPV
ncbi:MAG: phosphoenolpyruvate--protein phosphotransferase [Rhodobiaceae bacterium]|nr:phosphoenolpyruvate--protein phosphotransferase [Rhodobiaceae bacterium]